MNYTVYVCLKQVPESDDIKFDEKGNIKREGVNLVLNKYDEYALENALILKDLYGIKVIAVSMGPESATEVLRYAVSKGVDDAFLINDINLKGSDAFITSYVISKTLKYINESEHYSVFCGYASQDGDTKLVPPMISEFLNLEFFLGAQRIENIDFEKQVIYLTKVENGFKNTYRIPLKSVCSFDISDLKMRVISIKNKLKARKFNVRRITLDDIGIKDFNAIEKSPSYVYKIEKVYSLSSRSARIISFENNEEISEIKKVMYE